MFDFDFSGCMNDDINFTVESGQITCNFNFCFLLLCLKFNHSDRPISTVTIIASKFNIIL